MKKTVKKYAGWVLLILFGVAIFTGVIQVNDIFTAMHGSQVVFALSVEEVVVVDDNIGEAYLGEDTDTSLDEGMDFVDNEDYSDSLEEENIIIDVTLSSGFPESPHPYDNNYDNTWTYSIPGASSLNVTFSSDTQTEARYDFIYIMDAAGNNISGSPFSGTELAGAIKTVTGDTVKIRLKTDGSLVYYGFRVTNITAVTSPDSLLAEPSLWAIPYSSGTGTFAVTSNQSWNISGLPDWITHTKTAADFTLTASENTGIDERTANIEVRAGDLSFVLPVTQTGKPTTDAQPSQIIVNAVTGKNYHVTLSANGVTSFNGMEIKVLYDAAVFEVADLCAFTKNKELNTGPIATTGITITSVSPGEIRLTVDNTIQPGHTWAGVINIIQFKAKTTAQSTITIN